jgi:hypothetical protein
LALRQSCSLQIESKLAELPCQIASIVFMRPSENVDSNVLNELFRQIGTIVFQVMPQQIVFDSIKPDHVATHLLQHLQWPVPPQRQFQKSLDDSKNWVKLLKSHPWHHLQPPEYLQKFQQIPPQVECNNGLKEREEKALALKDSQSLGKLEVDEDNSLSQYGQSVWSLCFILTDWPQNISCTSYPIFLSKSSCPVLDTGCEWDC